MKTPKLFNKVHCHVCSMKECCDYSEADASWRLQRFLLTENDNVLKEDDWEKVERATANCPLRKLIREVEA